MRIGFARFDLGASILLKIREMVVIEREIVLFATGGWEEYFHRDIHWSVSPQPWTSCSSRDV